MRVLVHVEIVDMAQVLQHFHPRAVAEQARERSIGLDHAAVRAGLEQANDGMAEQLAVFAFGLGQVLAAARAPR